MKSDEIQAFVASLHEVVTPSDVPVTTSHETYSIWFRALCGRDPLTLRHPWTREIFWTEPAPH